MPLRIGDLPASLDGKAVSACVSLCGFATEDHGRPIGPGGSSPSGNCYHTEYNECGIPSYIADVSFGYDEAIICPTGTTCGDGSLPYPQDMSWPRCPDLLDGGSKD